MIDRPPRCPTHEHAHTALSYHDAQDDAAERMKRGEKQRQCMGCKLWLWPHEIGKERAK